MADLEFLVDFGSLKRANEEINKTGSNAQRSARVFEQAFQRVEREQKKALTSVRQQITASQRFERQKRREEQAALKAARTQAREIDNLRSKFNPLFAASKLYEKTQDELNRALSVGAINADQYAREIDQLNREFNEFSTTTSAANSAQNRFANQLRTGSIRSTNNLGVVAQQTGFQVGDFLVQIQSGANPMMAFGQQATQLAGVLPLLGDSLNISSASLLKWSVGLGIGIPLITAAAGAFFRMMGETKKAGDAISDFTSALGDYERIAERSKKTTSELIEEFGDFADEIQSISDLLSGAAVSRALGSLTTTGFFGNVDEAADAAIRLQDALEGGGAGGALSIGELDRIASRAAESIGLTKDQAITLDNALDEIQSSQSLVEVRDRAFEALKTIEGMTFESGKIPPELAKVVSELDKVLGAAARATAETENTVNAAHSLSSEMSSAADEALRFVNNLASGGGVADARAKVAGLRAELGVRKGGGGDVEAAVERARAEFFARAGESGVLNTPAGGEARAGLQRELEAARLGAIADQLSGQISGLGKTSSGGGGGGSSTSDPRAFLDSLQKELQLKELLVGVGDEQAQQLKLEAQLKENLEKVGKTITDADKERIETLVKQAEAIRKAEEAESRRQKAIEDFEKRTEDAITNIVKGADSIEDAFMGMIRSIVEELFRQQVAKPAAEALGGIFEGFFANGSAFSGGRVLPFADGGVVSNTTAFPLRDGNTGIMGEAGPEAILPLKRGKGGKLGVEGGGNTTVNQTFMFSANGDDSVKRIIAQEAPKIAKLTERSIIESRKRGGQIRSAFGGGN